MTEGADGQWKSQPPLRLVVGSGKKLFSENPVWGIGFQGFYFASDGLLCAMCTTTSYKLPPNKALWASCCWLCFSSRPLGAVGDFTELGARPFSRLGPWILACIGAASITNLFGDRFHKWRSAAIYIWPSAWSIARGEEQASPVSVLGQPIDRPYNPTQIHMSVQNYRPDIDGLRAVAVTSVLLFHAFPTCLSGGYVGAGHLRDFRIFDQLYFDQRNPRGYVFHFAVLRSPCTSIIPAPCLWC